MDFVRVFSSFARQASWGLEEISWAPAVSGGREVARPWCFTSSVSTGCWCHPLPGPSIPKHSWPCWGNPAFHFLLPQQPHMLQHGGLPDVGNGILACILLVVETPSTFTTSFVRFRTSHAWGWPATYCRSDTAWFNCSHSYSLRQGLSSLQFPSLPALRRGEDSSICCQRWHVGGWDSETVGRESALRLLWWNAHFKATKKKGG